MELKFAKEKAEEAVAVSAYQYVVFRVAVPDAIIRINGKTLKPKDGVVSAKLPLGRHDYEVSAPMYETTIGVLTVDDSQTKQEVPVSLRPLFTPMLLTKVLAGKHEIKLIKSRFEEQTKTVTVEENGTLTLEGTMKEALDNSNNSDNGRNTHNGHEYVDLGLTSGTLWATCNVGATKPEEYGDYFAWGETTGYNSGKTNFGYSTYKWCNESSYTLTKYCTESSYGTVDNKTELELSDDAARANWGGQWRMPSFAQINELISECNTEWTTQNSVLCQKITSKKNGRSIFLPAAGYRDGSSLYDAGSFGSYWSRSLYKSGNYFAFGLYFYSSDFYLHINKRCYGQSVRPVVSE